MNPIFSLQKICLAIVAVQSTQIFAETNPSSTPEQSPVKSLETIVITAMPSSVMSTTTGMQLSLKETPQSISVISQEQISNLGLNNIADALKQTTGINVIRDSGRYRFQSRGFYIDQIEEDGMSSTVASGASGNPYRSASSMTDLEIYQHIEVLRGASGLTQSNGEPGGTINAVRKKPTEEFQANGKLQYGSWDNIRSSVDVSGSLNQDHDIRGRVVAVAGDSESFKTSIEKNNQTLYGVLDFDLNDQALFRVGGLYQQVEDMPDIFGLPMGIGSKSLNLNKNTFLGADWSEDNFKKSNLFAELIYNFNDDWKLNSKVNATWYDSTQKFAALGHGNSNYVGVANDGLLQLNNMQFYDNDGDEFIFNTTLSGKYQLLGRDHDLFGTLNYSKENQNSQWKQHLNSTQYNIYTFQPSQITEPDWNDNSIIHNDNLSKRKIKQKAIALGTRFNLLDRLHLIAGGRYTDFNSGGSIQYYKYQGQIDRDYIKSADVKKKKFIPYTGLTFDFTPSTSIYVSYTEIFKPQSARGMNGSMLDPLIGSNQELGIKSELFSGDLQLAAALFQVKQENRAIAVAGTNFYAPEGKVRSRGLDLEISGKILPEWQLFAGYTYNKSKYLKTEGTIYENGTNFSKHTPEHMFRAYSSYQFSGALENLTVGAGVTAQTGTDSLYNVKQGGYTLYNANLRYRFNPNFALNLIGQNLSDKRYYENQKARVNGMNNFYGTPRNYLLSLEWNY
ncbi:TonB-dependent siderophore receptor [Acinetobacter puyangensis]|uniref:Outer-membrane receptor for ferric coprogen and ferric-rhodotorulic acid n=1 Tax=Acinetobacter puyangensis TaxID=1096779 RepID=A0A240EAG2_9GAMM|nr:TonB-dependent siderophore receptor [Acinetobacter puyangensis]SNX44890.1 outer-membrane receptor for ferric coprogen and ferric-rhodotorulic acid [Acinetobacter puyangensis]